MSSSSDSTPDRTGGRKAVAQPAWQRRMPLLICLLILAYWYLRPSSGAGFMRVPIAKVAAPAWALTNVQGQRMESSAFSNRVVVLNFWATFCPPCIREIPDLAAFHVAHSNDPVTVVGLSLDSIGAESVRAFVEKRGIPYPVALADATVAEAFGGVSQIPSTFVIARDGTFAARYLGALDREELERAVAPLISPGANPASR